MKPPADTGNLQLGSWIETLQRIMNEIDSASGTEGEETKGHHGSPANRTATLFLSSGSWY
jgi:hypothetical protein